MKKNKQEINNMLFANFLGWEVSDSARKLKIDVQDLPYGFNKLRLKDLKFHKSYDWLMLVVDKIDDLRFNTIIESFDTGTHINRSILISSSTDDKFEDIQYEGNNKRKHLLKACVHFIKWYNDNDASTSGKF